MTFQRVGMDFFLELHILQLLVITLLILAKTFKKVKIVTLLF